MTAYYNENDSFAAAWLRNLIVEGVIAKGEVDERSIVEVQPEDLKGFTQVHLFAGIGVWSHALRSAGWPDDEPVWTGSCPCPPFSAAGKKGCPFCKGTYNRTTRVQFLGDGHSFGCPSCSYRDPRHLWPEMWRLVEKHRPPTLFGEQVASADGRTWIDIVQSDLEAADYSFAPLNLCAAGFGAPHIRQRFFFVADADVSRGWKQSSNNRENDVSDARERDTRPGGFIECGQTRELANSDGGKQGDGGIQRGGEHGQRTENGSTCRMDDSQLRRPKQRDEGERDIPKPHARRASRELGNSESGGRGKRRRAQGPGSERYADVAEQIDTKLADAECNGREQGPGEIRERESISPRIGPANGYWRDAVWIPCKDGSYRPTQPEIFPLVDGPSRNRVGLLRGAGNAIVAPVAEAFIKAFMETKNG